VIGGITYYFSDNIADLFNNYRRHDGPDGPDVAPDAGQRDNQNRAPQLDREGSTINDLPTDKPSVVSRINALLKSEDNFTFDDSHSDASDDTIRPPVRRRIPSISPDLQALHNKMADTVLSGKSPIIVLTEDELDQLRKE